MTNIVETLQKCRITPSADIQPHEFLYSWNNKPMLARGELIAISGKAKSGKTYVCSIFAALASCESVLGLTGRPGAKVLWIDTEQSEDSTQEILCGRIGALIGHTPDPEQYIVYNLRQQHWQDRLTLVTSAICMHTPDLVIFDGIRDVVGDINDYQQAQDVITKLLSIASMFNTCIVCVLHQNKAIEDKTLRGALGTELQNKSFETYECSKDQDTLLFTMKQTATRKYDISSKLNFSVNDTGLPELAQISVPVQCATKTEHRHPFNPDYMTDGKINKTKLFAYILPEKKQMTWQQLRAVVMNVMNIESSSFADKLLHEALDESAIRLVEDEQGHKQYANA
ncbi:MAG: AAA family ATPase, partial [Bacteroidales bacterium]|nr:AAA family ATPase [Candidatus Colicola equi]